jgi:hypothetical protein
MGESVGMFWVNLWQVERGRGGGNDWALSVL